MGTTITLWHRTDSAAAILRDGFRDYTATYGTDRQFSGVRLSDDLLTPNEGAVGDTVLRVTLDCTPDQIRQFEWIEEGKGYREFLILAEFIVAHGTVTRLRKGSVGMRKRRRDRAARR